MKKIVSFCFFFALALLCSAKQVFCFSPVWNAGDAWTVEARYARSFGEDSNVKWSDPVYWKYEVLDSEDDAGERALVLEARNAADGAIGVRVWLSKELRPVVIAKARTAGDREEVFEIESDPDFPVFTSYTLAPFDFPVFPLTPGVSQTFTAFRSMGRNSDLRIPEILSQVASEIDKIPSVCGFERKETVSRLFEIRVSQQEGDAWFVQYWDPGKPWPVYGENNTMIYRLVPE